MDPQVFISILEKIKSQRPLIHSITNPVVMNFTANGLLAFGASPVMANAKEEVAEITEKADALILNLGMLNPIQLEAMLIAGKTANKNGIPIVLDPVGVPASSFRKDAVQTLLSALKISVIRGNAAEIACLMNVEIESKGVDSFSQVDITEIAIEAAKKLDYIIAMTGKEDLVTDGETNYTIKNGHPELTRVTGTGCLLSSIVGAVLAVHDNHLESTVAALTAYGVAAEQAAQATGNRGPGSFQIEFLNCIANLNNE